MSGGYRYILAAKEDVSGYVDGVALKKSVRQLLLSSCWNTSRDMVLWGSLFQIEGQNSEGKRLFKHFESTAYISLSLQLDTHKPTVWLREVGDH